MKFRIIETKQQELVMEGRVLDIFNKVKQAGTNWMKNKGRKLMQNFQEINKVLQNFRANTMNTAIGQGLKNIKNLGITQGIDLKQWLENPQNWAVAGEKLQSGMRKVLDGAALNLDTKVNQIITKGIATAKTGVQNMTNRQPQTEGLVTTAGIETAKAIGVPAAITASAYLNVGQISKNLMAQGLSQQAANGIAKQFKTQKIAQQNQHAINALKNLGISITKEMALDAMVYVEALGINIGDIADIPNMGSGTVSKIKNTAGFINDTFNNQQTQRGQ